MKTKNFIIFSIVLFSAIFATNFVFAEDKNTPGGVIPKLTQTANGPELSNGHVYPNWGPPCQRYTYSVIYRDNEGRKPEYMQIYFNGKMINMDKEDPNDNNYKKGVKYVYKYVPNKLGSNFYYFEAANGFGKTRASIIDSPDNGPVLFESAFDKNEVAVIDSSSGKKILSYPTGKEWIGGVALSDDGKYLAVKTSFKIYLFDTGNPQKPKWVYEHIKGGNMVGGDVKGGIDISGDGSKIVASIGQSVLLFDKSSNEPLWRNDQTGNAYNVAISRDGKYLAAATAGEEANPKTNLLILWGERSEKPLWQYHASGNFHDVSLSDDGKYIAGSTGCPDRRFYLFSKDSNKPLIKSDPLTRDSPVHRAKISADGMLAAIGSESDAGAVFLFSKDKGQVWKFPTSQGSSVRALSFTPNGRYIGAATFGGDAYIFDKDKNSPIASWKVNASLGGIDIADDGSFIATGGTDNKLHIFDRNSKEETGIPFEEYIEEVDISANGKYIAAGTGGSVYFFETYISQDRGKVFDCSRVIEPVSEGEVMKGAGFGNFGEQVKSSLCGDGKCEGPETTDNCARDCDPNFKTTAGKPLIKNTQVKLPGIWFGFLGSVLLLGIFTALRKFKALEKQRIILRQFNISKLSRLKLTGKKVTIALIAATIFFLIFTIAVILFKVIINENKDAVINQGEAKSGCGNNICEPDSAETKENCPKDCSAGD